MFFSGYVPMSTVDYKDHISFVLMTAGCNLRCPYCHNFNTCVKSENLLVWEEIKPELDVAEFGIDAVVITGGEPTIYAELPDLIRELKQYKKKIKLDTNGTGPTLLKRCIKLGVEFVSIDYKWPARKYRRWESEFRKSVAIATELCTPEMLEFRTTAHPGFLSEIDLLKVVNEIPEGFTWKYQPAQSSEGMTNPDLVSGETYSKEFLEKVFEKARERDINVVQY